MKWLKSPQHRGGFLILILLLGLTVTAAVLDKAGYRYSVLDREFYIPQAFLPLIRPGLNIQLTAWDIADDGTVTVRFTVRDDAGQPLDLNGVFSPGAIRLSFILARIPEGSDTYLNYRTTVQTSPITQESATQPTSDSGGSFERIQPGVYEYTFGYRLPADFDRTATHRIAFYSDRNLQAFDLGTQIEDGALTFVPDGSEVTKDRQLVTNQACSRCHDPLVAHGRRSSYEVCITCHVPGVIDPDTGNTIDFSVMVHKIHRGESLPSVEDGTPYRIIGFRQSVHDFSDVVFPQDHRNCTTCHAAEAAQASRYASNPNRAACGSCHDDVNFETGENHPGGPVASDGVCSACHSATMGSEFDFSVPGAHLIPRNSSQLAGINVEVLEVVHAGPGSFPAIRFRLTNDDGSAIDIATMDRVRFQLAGPTTDITFRATLDAIGAEPAGAVSPTGATMDGEYIHISEVPLPDDAAGTFAVGFEGRRVVTLNPGGQNEMQHTEQGPNPVFYFAVTDPEPVPRRSIVDVDKCQSCHEYLSLHGGNRHNASAYCQLCHNTKASDVAVRAEEDLPAQTIDFRFLIHRIHRGEELTRDFTVFGFRSSIHNYNDLRFPGDLRNCAKCHVGDSYFESKGIQTVPTEREFFSPMRPKSVACLGCHDTLWAAAHAFVGSTVFGESCGACHGPNREFATARVHSR